jgi:small conductance mechanosensitive channel
MNLLDLQWRWPWSLIVIASTLAIALIGYISSRWVVRRVIHHFERRLDKREPRATDVSGPDGTPIDPFPHRGIRRVKVVASLARSIWVALLVLFVILGLLWSVGVSVAPVLASAGVVSVIVGFGAQSLIKDLLAGVFLIAEDQYGIGDLITVGTLTGRVERVSLRITQVRDAAGMVWFVRNGEILTVGNVSQGYSTAIVDLPVAYSVDVPQAIAVLEQAVQRVAADPEVAVYLLEPPTLLGVETITPVAVTFRITAMVSPNQHWSVQRALRAGGLTALHEAGFPSPSPIPTT